MLKILRVMLFLLAFSGCVSSQEKFCLSPDGINQYGSVQNCQLAKKHPQDWECRTPSAIRDYNSVEECLATMEKDDDAWNCESKEDLELYGSRDKCQMAVEDPTYEECFLKTSNYPSIEVCKKLVNNPDASSCADNKVLKNYKDIDACIFAKQNPEEYKCQKVHPIDSAQYKTCLQLAFQSSQDLKTQERADTNKVVDFLNSDGDFTFDAQPQPASLD